MPELSKILAVSVVTMLVATQGANKLLAGKGGVAFHKTSTSKHGGARLRTFASRAARLTPGLKEKANAAKAGAEVCSAVL